jgi:hypothetical protein
MPPDPRILLDPKNASRRVAVWLVAVTLIAALAAQAAWAFDTGRREADAARLLDPSDPAIAARLVSHPLLPEPGADLPAGAGGEFRYDPEGELSLFILYGMPQPPRGERYLVYVRDGGGSALAGAAKPDVRGDAVVRFGAEPQPDAIFEVLITRAIDDADSSPHGEPLLRWFNPEVARFGLTPWQVARR